MSVMTRPIIFTAGLLLLAGCRFAAAQDAGKAATKTYIVRRIERSVVTVDGILSAGEWPGDGWLRDFSFPWRDRSSPKTEMCCVTAEKRLFFAFQCDDSDLVIRASLPSEENAVAAGDRVELFFARDRALAEYYCLEMSPAAMVLDYRASFYRKFDDSWDCTGLVLAACTRRGGYTVEGSIPLTTLRELCGADLMAGEPVLAGVFRAEYCHSHSGPPREAWISWVDPDTDEPDFHVPSALGVFQLQVEGERAGAR